MHFALAGAKNWIDGTLEKIALKTKHDFAAQMPLRRPAHCSILDKKHTRIPIISFHGQRIYGGYLVVSRPQFDLNGWIPYVLVSWRVRGELQFQKSPDLKTKFFSTESDALVFGFSTARAWVGDIAGARVQQVYQMKAMNYTAHYRRPI